MTLPEVRLWAAYRKKYGPLNPVRAYDRPAALIGSILSSAHGGKVKMADLMPWGKDTNGREPTLEELVGALGGVKLGRRR